MTLRINGEGDVNVGDVPLSVLEFATIGEGSSPTEGLVDTTELIKLAEYLGYKRAWVAEHHGFPSVASSAPAVLIAHLAASTKTIRVGSGGVLLPNHSPLVIAEQFGTLEALHPGRIDLGIGRAPGTDEATAKALRRNVDTTGEQFPRDVEEVVGYLTDKSDHPRSVPGGGYLSEIWILGSTQYGAEVAAIMGLPFSFAHPLNPLFTETALDIYRSLFRPSVHLQSPKVMVAVSVICAPTDEEARWLAGSIGLLSLQLRKGLLEPLPSAETAASARLTDSDRLYVESVLATHVIGNPTAAHKGLKDLVKKSGADELIISTRLHSQSDRMRSLELVAGAWNREM